MGLLKFGVYVVTWILCASKTSGDNTTLLNSELECVEGQDLSSAGPCNKCVCTQGRVICIDVECDLEPKQNATRLGPERNSLHENIRPPENDFKGLLSDQIYNKLPNKNDLSQSSTVTTKERKVIELSDTIPNITMLLTEPHAEDAINTFLTHDYGSDDKYILIVPEVLQKKKLQIKRDISSIAEISAHNFYSGYGLRRTQPNSSGILHSKQPLYRSKRSDNMFKETKGIHSSYNIDNNAVSSSVSVVHPSSKFSHVVITEPSQLLRNKGFASQQDNINNDSFRLTKRSNRYKMLQPHTETKFPQDDIPNIDVHTPFNQYGYNDPNQLNMNDANSLNSNNNVNTPKPESDQPNYYPTNNNAQNDNRDEPNPDETNDNAEQSTDPSGSKEKKSLPEKVFDHLSKFVFSLFDKPSEVNDQDTDSTYNDDIKTPETTIQNDDLPTGENIDEIPLSIKPENEPQMYDNNQNEPIYQSETYPNDMPEMINPVPIQYSQKPVGISPSPLIDYTNKPTNPPQLQPPIFHHEPRKPKLPVKFFPSVSEYKPKTHKNSLNSQKPFVNTDVKPNMYPSIPKNEPKSQPKGNILFNKPNRPLNLVPQSLNGKPIVHPHIKNIPPIKDVYPQQPKIPGNNLQSYQNVIEPPLTIKPNPGYEPKKYVSQNYSKLPKKPSSMINKRPNKKYPMQLNPDINQSPTFPSDKPKKHINLGAPKLNDIYDNDPDNSIPHKYPLITKISNTGNYVPKQYPHRPKKPFDSGPYKYKDDSEISPIYENIPLPKNIPQIHKNPADVSPINSLVPILNEEEKVYVDTGNIPMSNKYSLSHKKPTTGGKFYPQKNKTPYKKPANVYSKPKQILHRPKKPIDLNFQISDEPESNPEYENVPILQKYPLNKTPTSENTVYPKKVSYVAHIFKAAPKLSPHKPKEYDSFSPNILIDEPEFYPENEEIPKLNNYYPLNQKKPVSDSAFNPHNNKVPTDNMLDTFGDKITTDFSPNMFNGETEIYPEYENYALSDNYPLTSKNPFNDSPYISNKNPNDQNMPLISNSGQYPFRPKQPTNLKIKIIYDPKKFYATKNIPIPKNFAADHKGPTSASHLNKNKTPATIKQLMFKSETKHYVHLPKDVDSGSPNLFKDKPVNYPEYEDIPISKNYDVLPTSGSLSYLYNKDEKPTSNVTLMIKSETKHYVKLPNSLQGISDVENYQDIENMPTVKKYALIPANPASGSFIYPSDDNKLAGSIAIKPEVDAEYQNVLLPKISTLGEKNKDNLYHPKRKLKLTINTTKIYDSKIKPHSNRPFDFNHPIYDYEPEGYQNIENMPKVNYEDEIPTNKMSQAFEYIPEQYSNNPKKSTNITLYVFNGEPEMYPERDDIQMSNNNPQAYKNNISGGSLYTVGDEYPTNYMPQDLNSIPKQFPSHTHKKLSNITVQILHNDPDVYQDLEYLPIPKKYNLKHKKSAKASIVYNKATNDDKPYLHRPKESTNVTLYLINDKPEIFPEPGDALIPTNDLPIYKSTIIGGPFYPNSNVPPKMNSMAKRYSQPHKRRSNFSLQILNRGPEINPDYEQIHKNPTSTSNVHPSKYKRLTSNFKQIFNDDLEANYPTIYDNSASKRSSNSSKEKSFTKNIKKLLISFLKKYLDISKEDNNQDNNTKTPKELDRNPIPNNNPQTYKQPASENPGKRPTNKPREIFDSMPTEYSIKPKSPYGYTPKAFKNKPKRDPGHKNNLIPSNYPISYKRPISASPSYQNKGKKPTVIKPQIFPPKLTKYLSEPKESDDFIPEIYNYESDLYPDIENPHKLKRPDNYIPQTLNKPNMDADYDSSPVSPNYSSTHKEPSSERPFHQPKGETPLEFKPKQYPQITKKPYSSIPKLFDNNPEMYPQYISPIPTDYPVAFKEPSSSGPFHPMKGKTPSDKLPVTLNSKPTQYSHKPKKPHGFIPELFNSEPEIYSSNENRPKPTSDLPELLNSQTPKRPYSIKPEMFDKVPETYPDYKNSPIPTNYPQTLTKPDNKSPLNPNKGVLPSNTLPLTSDFKPTQYPHLHEKPNSFIPELFDNEPDYNNGPMTTNYPLSPNQHTSKNPLYPTKGILIPNDELPEALYSKPKQHPFKPKLPDGMVPVLSKNEPNMYTDYENGPISINSPFTPKTPNSESHFYPNKNKKPTDKLPDSFNAKPKQLPYRPKKPYGLVPEPHYIESEMYPDYENRPKPTNNPLSSKKPYSANPFDPKQGKKPTDKLPGTFNSKPKQYSYKPKKPYDLVQEPYDSNSGVIPDYENGPKPTYYPLTPKKPYSNNPFYSKQGKKPINNLPGTFNSKPKQYPFKPELPNGMDPVLSENEPNMYTDYENSPIPTDYPNTHKKPYSEIPFYPNQGKKPTDKLPETLDAKPKQPYSLKPELYDNEPKPYPDYENGAIPTNYPYTTKNPDMENPFYPKQGAKLTDNLPDAFNAKPKQYPYKPKKAYGLLSEPYDSDSGMYPEYENGPKPTNHPITPKKPYSENPFNPKQGKKPTDMLPDTFNSKPEQYPYEPKKPYGLVPDPFHSESEMYPDYENGPKPTNYAITPQSPHTEIPLYPGLDKKPNNILPETLYSKPKQYPQRPKKPYGIMPELHNKKPEMQPKYVSSLISTKVSFTTIHPDSERPFSTEIFDSKPKQYPSKPKKPYSLTPEPYDTESKMYPDYEIDQIPANYPFTPEQSHSGNPFYPNHGKNPENKLPVTLDSNHKQYPHKLKKPYGLVPELYDNEPKTHPDYDDGPISTNDPFTPNNPNSEIPFHPKKSKRPTNKLPKIFDPKPKHALKPKKPYSLTPEPYDTESKMYPDYEIDQIPANYPFTPEQPHSGNPFYPNHGKNPENKLPVTLDSNPKQYPHKPKKPYGLVPELYDNESKTHPDYDDGPISTNDPFTPNNPNSEIPFYPKKSKRPTDKLPKTFDLKPKHPLKPKKPYGLTTEPYDTESKMYPDYEIDQIPANYPFTPEQPHSGNPFYPNHGKNPENKLPVTLDSNPKQYPHKPKKPYGLVSELYDNEPKTHPDYDDGPISSNDPFTPNNPNSERPFYPKKGKRPTDKLPKTFDSNPNHPLKPKKPYGFNPELVENDSKMYLDYEFNPNYPLTNKEPNSEIPFNPNKDKNPTGNLPLIPYSKPNQHPHKEPDDLSPALIIIESDTYLDEENNPVLYIYPSSAEKSDPFHPNKGKKPTTKQPKIFGSLPKQYPHKPKKPYGLIAEIFNSETVTYPDNEYSVIPASKLPELLDSMPNQFPQTYKDADSVSPQIFTSEPDVYPDYENDPRPANYPLTPQQSNSDSPFNPSKDYKPKNKLPHKFSSESNQYPEKLNEPHLDYENSPMHTNVPLSPENPGNVNPLYPKKVKKPSGNIPLLPSSNPEKYQQQPVEPDGFSPGLVVIESDMYLEDENYPVPHIYQELPENPANGKPLYPNKNKKPIIEPDMHLENENNKLPANYPFTHKNPANGNPLYSKKVKNPTGNIQQPLNTQSENYLPESKLPDNISPDLLIIESDIYLEDENNPVPNDYLLSPEHLSSKNPTSVLPDSSISEQYPHKPKGPDGFKPQIFNNEADKYPEYEDIPIPSNFPLQPSDAFNPSQGAIPTSNLPQALDFEPEPYPHKSKDPYDFTPEILNSELKTPLDYENNHIPTNYPLTPENAVNGNPLNPKIGKIPASKLPNIFNSILNKYPHKPNEPDGFRPLIFIIETDMDSDYEKKTMPKYPITPQNSAIESPFYPKKENILKSIILQVLQTLAKQYPHNNKEPTNFVPKIYKDKAENYPDYEFIVITDDSYIRPESQITDYPSISHPTDIDELCRECTKMHCCSTTALSDTGRPIYSESPYQSLNPYDEEYKPNSFLNNNYKQQLQIPEPINNKEPQYIPDIISDHGQEPHIEYVIPLSDNKPISLSEGHEHTSRPVDDLIPQYIHNSVTENNDEPLYISLTPVDHEKSENKPNHFLDDSHKIPLETIRPLNDEAPQINANTFPGNSHELPFESFGPSYEKTPQYTPISFSNKSYEQPLSYVRPNNGEKIQYKPDTSFDNSYKTGGSPIEFVSPYDYEQSQYRPNTIIENNPKPPLKPSKTFYETSQYVPNSFTNDKNELQFSRPLDNEQNHVLGEEGTDRGSIPRGWHKPDILPDLDYDLPYLTMPAYDNLLEQIPHEKVRDLTIPPFEYYINQKGTHKHKPSKNISPAIGSSDYVEPRLEYYKDKQDITLNAMQYPWQNIPILLPMPPQGVKQPGTSGSSYEDGLITYIDTKVRNNDPKRFYGLRENAKLNRFGKPLPYVRQSRGRIV